MKRISGKTVRNKIISLLLTAILFSAVFGALPERKGSGIFISSAAETEEENQATEPAEIPAETPTPDSGLPELVTEKKQDDFKLRVGLKYGSSVISLLTTGSDTGGSMGITKGEKYTPIVNFTGSDTVTAKPDSGYHILLTDALTGPDEARKILPELTKLLTGLDATPFYLYDGSDWYIAVSFFNSKPGPGVSDVNGLKKWDIVSEALKNTSYKLKAYTASQVAIKAYINGKPTLVLSVPSGYGTQIRIVPAQPEKGAELPALMNLGNGKYRGVFDVFRLAGENLTLVNDVYVEDYLYSVVPTEMSVGTTLNDWNSRKESLKVQAILARSKVIYRIEYNLMCKCDFQVDSTVNYQAYSGYVGQNGRVYEVENAWKAVDQTSHVVLMCNGIVCRNANYSSNNGGYSEYSSKVWGGSDPDYLVSKPDQYNPIYTWKSTFTGASIAEKLKKYVKSNNNIDVGTIKYINVTSRTESGRAYTILLEGTDSNASITRGSTRTCLDLKSQLLNFSVDNTVKIRAQSDGYNTVISDKARYYLEGNNSTAQFLSDSYAVRGNNGYLYERIKLYGEYDTRKIVVTGNGYGHGVGLSQEGAKVMSQLGYTYKDILKHYFANVEIVAYPVKTAGDE